MLCNPGDSNGAYQGEGPFRQDRGVSEILEDEEIIALYLNRDEAAVKQTAEKYGQRLRALSLRIAGDWQTAEECENDTYMEAWRSIPPHKPET